jgi:4-hydroxybenzoyl-CoA thioesterase
MARLQIEVPDPLPFPTAITLYQSHMNWAGHLDNAQLLAVVSEARLRWFKSFGYTEDDVEGRGVIVADAALQYLSEAFHGEVMEVGLGAADFNKYGCDVLWRMRDQASGREVARGKTGIVFYDYEARRIATVPEGFRRRFPA